MMLPLAIVRIVLVFSVGLLGEASFKIRGECRRFRADASFERKGCDSPTQWSTVMREKPRKCQNFTVDVIRSWNVKDWAKRKVAESSVEQLTDINMHDIVDRLKVLLYGGLDKNTIFEFKSDKTNNKSRNITLLGHASLYNAFRIVKLLADQGADLNLADKESGVTPLMWAVSQTCVNVTEFLLEHGANVNAVSKNGFTALHFSVHGDSDKIIKVLGNKRANTEATLLDNGYTPLLLAASECNVCSVQCLLDLGVNKSAQSKDGKTAKELASEEFNTAKGSQREKCKSTIDILNNEIRFRNDCRCM